MATLREVAQDPDFQTLPDGEKLKALKELEPDLSTLPFNEQMAALKDLTGITEEDPVKRAMKSVGQETKEAISQFSKPIPGAGPALGAVTGTVLSGGNPLAGVGGYYAGKQAERGLSEGRVGTPSEQSGDINEGMIQEIFGGILKVLPPGLGAKYYEKIFSKEALGDLARTAKLPPEVLERLNLAKETGVDLSPGAIKGEKGTMQLESFLDKNITSSTIARKGHEKTLQQVGEFAQRVQEQFGGKATMLQAGEAAQSGAKGRYGAFMSKAQKLYDAVPVEKSTLVETNNLRDSAIGMLDEIGKIDAPAMKRILNIAKGSVDPQIQYKPGSIVSATGQPLTGGNMPTYTWQELTSDRNALNQMWRQSSDPNRKRLISQLVDAIDDDIAKFSELNPNAKAAFDKARTFYKYGDESLPGVPIFRDRQIKQVLTTNSTEDIVGRFIKPNNASDIKRLVSVAGKEGTQVVKQAWLEKLLTKGEEQSFSPAKFATAFEKYDKDTLNALLNPEEISGLQKLAKIGRLVGKAEKIAGNPSGTAQNVLTGGWLASFLHHPVMTATAAIGSNKLAKLYFENPEFRKNLILGFKMSSTSKQAINLASRLSAIAGLENKETISELAE